MSDPVQHVHTAANALAGIAVVATIVGWLPAIAAVLGIIWYVIQIIESKTVRDWRTARRMRRHDRKLARLLAKAKVVGASIKAMTIVAQAEAVAADKIATAEGKAADKIADAETKAAEISKS